MYPIAIGLIFIFFSFTINLLGPTVDLLPDFVGYALIAYSAWKLRANSYAFSHVLWLSAVMTVYAALAHYFAPTGLLGLAVSALETAGTVWLLILLARGVGEYEDTEKCSLRWEQLDRWKLLTVAAYIAVFACTVALEFIPLMGFFTLLVLLYWAVSCVGYTVCFFRTARRWKHRHDDPGRGGKQILSGPLPPHKD